MIDILSHGGNEAKNIVEKETRGIPILKNKDQIKSE